VEAQGREAAVSIVVGVDGSAASGAALRWALDEASLRETNVGAVHAWHAAHAGGGAPPDDIGLESVARRALDAVVDADDGGKDVSRLLVRGVPASALLDAARLADLLVLGGATGAVARHVLAHAPCPVVVVPA
jgi:nucleotide-binding universal stress UspA family protein